MTGPELQFHPGGSCYFSAEGHSWSCAPGDVIGRSGNVASDFLSTVPVLSRQHLRLEYDQGIWQVTALAGTRNETFMNGLPMERGVPYPVGEIMYLQVDAFCFQLGSSEAPTNPGWPAPGSASPLRPASGNPDADETHSGPGSANVINGLPVALVETDLRLHVTAANPLATALLGEDAVGRDLDAWMPSGTMVRNHLLGLDDGASSDLLETEITLPCGPCRMEVQARRTGEKLYILLRNVTAERAQEAQRQQVADHLANQSGILAELSLSRAFQEGDVAKSLTLLAHRAAAALDCRRVSVWIQPEDTPEGARQVVCQVCHDISQPGIPGALTDLAYCPFFFDQLDSGEPCATADAGSPVLDLLQEIGFAQRGIQSLLCVALQHADGFYGVIGFERESKEKSWTVEERQFALCLASYGVLALQTRERREALSRLQISESRMTAELEEANRYVQRILSEPIPSGPITAEWHMMPSEALGGDSFGYHWVGELFVMYILDVVGHGTGMALLSISVLNNVRARLLLGEAAMSDPAGVLQDLNAAFPMEDQNNMLFSMWYGVYDRRTRQLTYASAGHPPAILLHGECPDEGEDYATLGTEAPSVGAMQGMVYSNGRTTVDRGAKLYIFTDGVFEIPLGPDREWSFDEFIAVVRSTRYMPEGEPAYLRKRIGALCCKPTFPDDFTVIRFAFEE